MYVYLIISTGSTSVGVLTFWKSQIIMISCPRCPWGGTNSGSGVSSAGDCFRAGLGVICCCP
jgi:hypothetical protein